MKESSKHSKSYKPFNTIKDVRKNSRGKEIDCLGKGRGILISNIISSKINDQCEY